MNIAPYSEDRNLLLPLFELADDSPAQISKYISRGELLVVREEHLVIGHLQIVETDDAGVFEIKSMAVMQIRQGEGIGRSLVRAAVVHCRARNGHRLIVSTATADVGNLRFYQQQGFRMYKIVRDAFAPASGYPKAIVIDGVPLRDQVFLDLDLTLD